MKKGIKHLILIRMLFLGVALFIIILIISVVSGFYQKMSYAVSSVLGGNGTTLSSVQASDNERFIYSFFKEKGLGDVQICAIMGCWWAESGMNPGAIEAGNPDYKAPGVGIGLAQWTDRTRKENGILAYAEDVKGSTDDWADIELQCEFAWMEMCPSAEKKHAVLQWTEDQYNTFLRIEDLPEATTFFRDYYERGGANVNYDKRIDRAQHYMDMVSLKSEEDLENSAEGNNTELENEKIGAINGDWMWPSGSTYITSTYGWRDGAAIGHGATSWHAGIDIGDAGGNKIYASRDGTVVISTFNSARGYYIVIDHGGQAKSLYQHCSALYAAVGQSVKQGDVIAAVGNTGDSAGNHLHFEIWYSGSPVNPLLYVNP